MAPKIKNAIPPVKYNKEKGCNTTKAGAQKLQHAPRLAVEIDEDLLFKKLFPNTEMAVDVKIYADKPGRMAVGDTIAATVTRDGEDHFTILQMAREKLRNLTSRTKPKVKRNPIILPGTYINVHEAEDGTRYPTFNRPEYTENFTFYDLCLGAAQELLAVAGLVGKGLSTK